MPSADMRSNRCVPLRGTSAGYASASSAFIRLLKSGGSVKALREAVCALDGCKYELLVHIASSTKSTYFSEPMHFLSRPFDGSGIYGERKVRYAHHRILDVYTVLA